MPLRNTLFSDFIAFRLLYHLEPLTTAMPILAKMVEIVEKSLKFNVAIHQKREDALSSMCSEFGHRIEKLRSTAASFNAVFDDADIVAFASDFNDKRGGSLPAITVWLRGNDKRL